MSYPKVAFEFDGTTYRWRGWFGCQLESRERREIKAGTARELDFQDGKPPVTIRVVESTRVGFFGWRTTWKLPQPLRGDYTDTIESFRTRLKRLV